MRSNHRRHRGSVLRSMLWLLSGLLLLSVIALAAFDVYLRGQYEPTLGTLAKDATDKVDFFCEQQAKLAEDPWFHEPRNAGDAGPLLNVWLGWDPGPAMPEDSPLKVPAHLPQTSKDWGDSWLTADADVDLSGLDFGWMRQLHAYDRWDMVKNAPITMDDPFNLLTTSVPNFLPLQLWAKFRLAHGLRTGQPLEAARDVRHLAWLAYRTDSLLGTMIGAALLNLETKAHASMKSPPPEWRPMSLEQLDRMRAVFFASLSFSSIVSPEPVARKARSCGSAISRCVALTEAGFTVRYMRPVAENLSTYRDAYAGFARDLAREPCPTSLARTIWERGATYDDPKRALTDYEPPAWTRRLPRAYTGRHIAGTFLSMSPSHFERLDNLRAPPEAPATAGAEP